MGRENKNKRPRKDNETKQTDQDIPISDQQRRNLELKEPDIHYRESTKLLVWLINVIIAIGATTFVLFAVNLNSYPIYIISENSLIDQIIPQLTKFVCLLVLVQLLMKDWMEVVQENTNNQYFRCHQNIISNHILWTIIFIGLFLIDQEQAYSERKLLLQMVDIFCVGRVIFLIGYMMGTMIGFPSFRALGFGFTTTSIVGLASLIFKFKFFAYFK